MIIKLNVKKIKLLGLLILSCFITLSFVKVDALELNFFGKSNAKVKKVADDKKSTCIKANNDDYVLKISSEELTETDSSVKITVSYAAKKRGNMTSTPTANDFYIYLDKMDSGNAVRQYVNFNKSSDRYYATFVADANVSGAGTVSVFAVSANNQFCEEMTSDEVNAIANLYKGVYNLSAIKDSNGNIVDPYKGKFIMSYTTHFDSENDLIDYGDPEEIEDNSVGSIDVVSEGFDSSGLPDRNPSEVQEFTCSKFDVADRNSNGSTISYADYVNNGANYFKNKTSFKHQEKETITAGYKYGQCEKTCEEIISVEYGPPVASIAGFCFEYAVKVTSKLKCNKSYKSLYKPTPSKFITCTVAPKCNNSTEYWDQAGPSAEYDSCISDCDGGKYSKKCTDKCYSKIYGKNNKTQLNAFDTDYKVQPLTVSGDDSIMNKRNITATSANVNAISYYATNNNVGYYYKSGSSILWYGPNQGDVDRRAWYDIGRYYLSATKAERTIISISTSATGELRGGNYYHYFIDKNGFKRACLNKNCDQTCDEKCHWFVVENGNCTKNNIMNNTYYGNRSDVKTVNFNGKTYTNVYDNEASSVNGVYVFMNKEDASYVYAKKMDEYKKEKSSCLSDTSCERTEQTVFTIKVDLSDTKSVEFPIASTGIKDIITKDNKWQFNHPTPSDNLNSTILNADNGTCINSASTYPYNYHVDWSFPGTWINNKNGDISYESKESTAGWKLKQDKFCLPLTLESANTRWYEWKIAYDETINDPNPAGVNVTQRAAAVATAKTLASTEVTKYNINASAKDFGKFNWDIDIKCFYATPPTTTCITPPCDEVYDYEVRTVDLANLFPAETAEGENNVNKSVQLRNSSGTTVYVGKEPGYNWTSAVESTKKSGTSGTNPNGNENYPVDPVALIKKVQDSETPGTGVKSTYDASNIDYKFDLNKDGLSVIKNYFKDSSGKSKNYGNFSNSFVGDGHGEMGISSYKSPLITKLVSNGYGSRNRKIGCNNSKDSHTCEVIE